MRFRFLTVCGVIAALSVAAPAVAQTGSIQGRVIFENQPMPGVTVSVTSPALQGQQATVTNVQGDYKIPFLPAGDYKVRFDLAEFATLEYDVRISTNQPRTLDAIMYPEAMQEEIVITGQFENVSTGSQGSSTMEQSVLEKLPIQRTLVQAVGLSAGTSATGARNNIVISGAHSYENLYTMNGVVMNENIRGGAYDQMYIEDAVLETTTMTSNMSAEYGRFSGGVVNMVTKSGGNQFSGSFRANFDKESWNGETPLTTSQSDTLNTIYEATFGGYILRDKLWFFAAGRSKDESTTKNIVTLGQPEAGIPYVSQNPEDRYEGKLTWGVTPSHRLMGTYMKVDEIQTNYAFDDPADWGHIVPERGLPLEAFSFNYTGVLSDNFFLEALYSNREFLFEGGGGTDPRYGSTYVRDYRYGIGFNAPTFCSASEETPLCTDESRSAENYYAKASWFANGAGTHDIVFGYDHFDDMRQADNWQSANGYQWGPFVDQDYSTPGSPLIVAPTYGSWILWGAVLEESQGNHIVTDSLFVNDTWRLSDRWTVNLGLRYDKNDATDEGGATVVNDSRISPRLSATWDVKGDGSLIVNAGASRYTAAVHQLVSDGSAAGGSSWGGYLYGGPSVYAGTDEYPTNFEALEAIFDWFINVYGGPGQGDLQYWLDYPGLTPAMSDSINSPYGDEYTIGASLRLGTRGVVRADLVHREYGSFYVSEIVPNRTVENPSTGELYDLAEYVNHDSGLKREYNGLQTRFDYRLGSRWNFGASYTYSKTEGNVEGDTVARGAAPIGYLEYQEYRDPAWSAPIGYLSSDSRHKFRGWVVWDAISTSHNNLSLSLLQSFWSGQPHSESGSVATVGIIGDPADLGYVGQPGFQTYFFSERGAYQFDDVTRTDLAINYSFFINVGGGQVELFVQPEVQNVFNEQAVVTGNSTELTAINDASLLPFDPWTETPVEGVHWRRGDEWGQAEDDTDYQLPRTYRISVGIRF
jgi:outer membrane receptor protein involved in Fe transport